MIMKTKSTSNKHIPQRTCIACRRVKDKRQLIRLVRSAGGDVQIDGSGRMPGRGAYLCNEAQCWQSGLSGNCLEHVLRIKLSNEDRQRLIEYGKTLSGGLLNG